MTAEEAHYNYWVPTVHVLFLDTIRDQQLPAGKYAGFVPGVVPGDVHSASTTPGDLSWTAAYPLIARWLQLYYGEAMKPVVRDHWSSLKAWADGVAALAKTERSDGLPDFYVWGDWCAVEAPPLPFHPSPFTLHPPPSPLTPTQARRLAELVALTNSPSHSFGVSPSTSSHRPSFIGRKLLAGVSTCALGHGGSPNKLHTSKTIFKEPEGSRKQSTIFSPLKRADSRNNLANFARGGTSQRSGARNPHPRPHPHSR